MKDICGTMSIPIVVGAMMVGLFAVSSRAGDDMTKTAKDPGDGLVQFGIADKLKMAAEDADFAKPYDFITIAAAAESPGIIFTANNNGVTVGVQHEFSTWSDMTAIFRPSRWSSPFKDGGSLSWLTIGAWADAPGRTAKVLLGEAIVVGAGVAIAESGGGGGGSSGQNTTQAATTPQSSSNSGGGSASSGSSSGSTSIAPAAPAGGSSSSGGSSGGGTEVPF
jgi:hypothetical protein